MNILRLFLVLVTLVVARPASAIIVRNTHFQITFDDTGISNLQPAQDVHDTEYMGRGARLGGMVLRYRMVAGGDWREVRELIRSQAPGAPAMSYTLATRPPSLAALSSPSCYEGVGGLAALSDGRVPAGGGGGGRGGRGGRGAGGGGGDAGGGGQVPSFTWNGQRRGTQYVQYTFPGEVEISRTELFWSGELPKTWRLLYSDGKEWQEVERLGEYGMRLNGSNVLNFTPVRTSAMRIEITLDPNMRVGLAEWRVGPDPVAEPMKDIAVRESFELKGDALEWSVTLANQLDRPVEIGDLALPLPFSEGTPANSGDIYTDKLLRHAYVGGNNSWVYWGRSNGVGPYLLLSLMGDTKFEYWDSSGGGLTPYVHGKAALDQALAGGGSWRLPASSLTLAPKGDAKADVTYRLRFQWVKDNQGVRDQLYANNQIDVAVVPGMVVPSDLPAQIALRTHEKIEAVEAEHGDATTIKALGERGGAQIYEVGFAKLGENVLKVKYGGGKWMTLEFFVMEPMETVIKKRAAFLAGPQQHKDLSKWYAGVYSDWDQRNQVLRGPEDRDGQRSWLVDAGDDAGNARPAVVAGKNVFFPVKSEIESVELYISRYLWGGMQRKADEKYPYAIYGVPNWKANRENIDPGRDGQAHVWRVYDYPHIINLYHRMYQVAKFYPEMISQLDAATYLERAYRTAVAYWTAPWEVTRWSANSVGTMNEACISDLLESLEAEGKTEWASTLRGYWEGKVERFVNHPPNLYGSEFAFDSTGFESTQALAHYAMNRVPRAGETIPADAGEKDLRRLVSRDKAQEFLEFQMQLNIMDRGALEPTYYQYGTDYRSSPTNLLSYMSFQHIGILSLEFHVDKLSRPLL